MNNPNHYDVIIVGGRPAGSTLAARLGAQGLKTLLLERATMPSLPAASSPIIYSPTLKMLDEIGADENQYAHNTPRIYRVVADNRDFHAAVPIPHAYGRNYAYAIDRARFDAALWENAARFPSVTVRQNYNVTDLLRDGDRVIGIVGHETGGMGEQITTDLVVGADGRFSLVARKVNARIYDEHDAYPTSLYYAYWKNVRPYDDGGASAVAYDGGYGYGFLMMDSADGQTAVTMEGQADLLNPEGGQVKAFYLDMLKTNPRVWARLQGAEMVTNVHGMRRIGNLYRQSGGTGWALVGDAYHQHDPLDGQGIFNAVFTAKSLAWAIAYWRGGDKTWSEAADWYDETARIKTYSMYKMTLSSVRSNLYADNQNLPGWAIAGLRWFMEDPATHDLIGKMLTRQLPPELMQLGYPRAIASAIMRGPLRDLRKRLLDVGLPI